MATVMPHGVLFRSGQEKMIREGIVRDDLIQAIIGLPAKLFYNVGIPACVIVINKNKPEELKDKILFINADKEYAEGRNQNFLRPEDIEKITTVFDNKMELHKYSRLVDIKEIEENDFNLNIRRYVDNSPDPEMQDIHGHLLGGILKMEVALYDKQFQKLHISPKLFLENKNDNYLDFKNTISDKNQIKEIIENSIDLKKVILNHSEKLKEWWNEVKIGIDKFYGNNNLWGFRNKSIQLLKEKLLSFNTLDEFKIAGIFVNWWEELRYDFKTIVSTGWSKNLIEDETTKSKYFQKELEEIEKTESQLAEKEGELNELLEEIEDWDEDEQGEKTANKVKEYLKEVVKELKENGISAYKEFTKLEDLLSRIEQKEKELKVFRKQLNNEQEKIENGLNQKRESLKEQEIKELLLDKFYNIIDEQLNKYLNDEKKEIIKIFENLWDKYKISLTQLKEERDEEVQKLDEYLISLGYYNERS